MPLPFPTIILLKIWFVHKPTSFPLSSAPVDGAYGSWSSWSECSSDCAGTQTRSRVCDSPLPRCQGAMCQGPAYEARECGDSCSTSSPQSSPSPSASSESTSSSASTPGIENWNLRKLTIWLPYNYNAFTLQCHYIMVHLRYSTFTLQHIYDIIHFRYNTIALK